jgi:hypothetical protein
MSISSASLKNDREEARRELSDTLAAMAGKVSATREELYPPALTAGVLIAAGAGFFIGSRDDDALAPLVYAAAGFCGWKIIRHLWASE